jgi:hypothetical protein
MGKLKPLIGFAVIFASLLVLATPAVAWFEATNSSSGENTVKPAGKALAPLIFKIASVGGKLECEASKTKIDSWKIQEPNGKPEKVFAQKQVKSGPDEIFVISCEEGKGNVDGVDFTVALSKCPVHVQQTAKGAKTEGHGAMIMECAISVPAFSCAVAIPAGKETTGENLNLKTVSQENGLAGNTVFKAAIGELHFTSTCPVFPGSGVATMTGEAELFGQKVI